MQAQKTAIHYRNKVISNADKVYDKLYSRMASMLEKKGPPKFLGASREHLQRFKFIPGYPMKHHLSFSFGYADRVSIHYQLGAAQCLKDLLKQNVLESSQFLGSGWGGVVAVALAAELDLGVLKRALYDIHFMSEEKVVGPLGHLTEILESMLHHLLPDDIQAIQHKIYISLTKLPSFASELKTDFKDKQELIQFMLATLYIPVIFINLNSIQ